MGWSERGSTVTAKQGCAECNSELPPRDKNQFFPFCSERCRLVDLGHWLEGDYRIPDVSGEGSESAGPSGSEH